MFKDSGNPFSILSVGILIAGLAVALALSVPAYRFTKTRQIAAMIACIVALGAFYLFLLDLRRPITDIRAASMVCLGFSFVFGLSAIRGTLRIVCLTAIVLNAFSLYLIAKHSITGLDTILSEYRATRWLTQVQTIGLAAATPIAWLVASYWLLAHLRLPVLSDARLAQGLCPSCGYDLRGTSRDAACPECGHAVEWNKISLSNTSHTDR